MAISIMKLHLVDYDDDDGDDDDDDDDNDDDLTCIFNLSIYCRPEGYHSR